MSPPARTTAPPAPAAPTPIPPAPASAPGTPGALAAQVARTVTAPTPPLPEQAPAHELQLRGGEALEAPPDVLDYVRAGERRGAPVRVRAGTVAAGLLTVTATRDGHLRTTGPLQGIPLLMPLTEPLRAVGIEPVLAVRVGPKGTVTGFASLRTEGGAVVGSDDRLGQTLRKNAAAVGWQGLDRLRLPNVTNRLEGPTLVVGASNLRFGIAGFLDGEGAFEARNETVTFDATATGKVPGLAEIRIPIRREADGSLSGKVTVDLDDLKGFTGQVEASYAGGAVDIIGTVQYANEKFDGSVTIAATDRANAAQLTAAHTPAEVESAAPAVDGAAAPAATAPPAAAPATAPATGDEDAAPPGRVTAKPGPRVIVGWGTVTVQLAEWLTGEAAVVVDPDGDVTIVGKITPQMTKPLFEQEDHHQPLGSLQVSAGYGLPVVGNVGLFAKVGLAAEARIGPATIKDMEMTGTWSTKPSVLQSFGLTGTLNVSAYAGLRLTAEGGAKLTIADHDIKAGVGVSALAGIRGYVEATPRIGYRELADPQTGKRGEFFISGHLEIAAQPFLGLSGELFIELDSPWWSPAPDKRWPWPIGSLEYPLPGAFGIGADVEHVLGSGKVPQVTFGAVDFSAEKFMTDLVRDNVPPKRSQAAETKGTWAEPPAAEGAAPGAAAPAPPGALPTGAPGQPPAVTGKAAGGPGAEPPAAGGPSGRTEAEAKAVPRADQDARWKAATAALAREARASQGDPVDAGEITEVIRRLKAAGFTSVSGKRVGQSWELAATLNPTIKGNLKADPADPATVDVPDTPPPVAAAQQPRVLSSIQRGSKLRFRTGKRPVTLERFVGVTRVSGGRSETTWMAEYKEGGPNERQAALNARGQLLFELVEPAVVAHRDRKLTVENRTDKRGEHVEGEVGVSGPQPPKEDPPGVQILKNGPDDRWVRAHLLNGKLDGPGEAWNLAIAPERGVNIPMRDKYEKKLVEGARQGKRYWFSARVSYRDESETSEHIETLRARNAAFRVSDFPKAITIRYAEIITASGGDTRGATTPHRFLVRLPKEAEVHGSAPASPPPGAGVRVRKAADKPTAAG
ncbi:hypothetical protein PU560_12475 [Georgenia sp. 10Sc9-8]|uniref:Uncharacterized protein n=1 Tax=Georgenia halotolerans TaxID=3028317 RepID=A0ABT5TYY1_9MICO|nr:hypothetical protein [Georgenia halotolerans]